MQWTIELRLGFVIVNLKGVDRACFYSNKDIFLQKQSQFRPAFNNQQLTCMNNSKFKNGSQMQQLVSKNEKFFHGKSQTILPIVVLEKKRKARKMTNKQKSISNIQGVHVIIYYQTYY